MKCQALPDIPACHNDTYFRCFQLFCMSDHDKNFLILQVLNLQLLQLRLQWNIPLFKKHVNKAKGSMQSKIDPFTLSVHCMSNRW